MAEHNSNKYILTVAPTIWVFISKLVHTAWPRICLRQYLEQLHWTYGGGHAEQMALYVGGRVVEGESITILGLAKFGPNLSFIHSRST